jgi:hypothetical protein
MCAVTHSMNGFVRRKADPAELVFASSAYIELCVSTKCSQKPSLNCKKKLTSHVVAAIDPVDLHAARCGGTLLGSLLNDLE